MRIGFFQFAPLLGRPEQNLKALAAALTGAEADLIVAPELALSGYLFTRREEVEEMAEPIPGPATDRLERAAADANCHLVVGMAERSGKELFNSAALIGPKGLIGVYRKVHLFHEEKLYFSPGDGGFSVFDVTGVKVGLLVCFDHIFPEAARTLALQGAQIICHPSNLVLPEYGQLTTRVRSIENKVFWILANRYGTERRGGKTLTYTGCSQITADNGEVLVRADERGDSLTVVDVDPERAKNKQVTERNDLFADRRVALYRWE
ncbi:(R)-stereoselective amidase [subsurface metagenome]